VETGKVIEIRFYTLTVADVSLWITAKLEVIIEMYISGFIWPRHIIKEKIRNVIPVVFCF